MRKKQCNKSKYIICLTFILVLGLIGSSFAMWSESNFSINKIRIGNLLADVTVDLNNGNQIIVKEISRDKNKDKDSNNQDTIVEVENGQNEVDYNIISTSGNDQNPGNHYGNTEYECNYEFLGFEIVRKGTIPLLLEKCEIYLSSENISNNAFNANKIKDIEIIGSEFIKIEFKNLKLLADRLTTGENDEITISFFFRQSNLKNNGWLKEETIRIPITKVEEKININNEANDNNKVNDELINNENKEDIIFEDVEEENLVNEDNYSLLDDNNYESSLIDNDYNESSNDIENDVIKNDENDVIEDNIQDSIEENIDGGDGNES